MPAGVVDTHAIPSHELCHPLILRVLIPGVVRSGGRQIWGVQNEPFGGSKRALQTGQKGPKRGPAVTAQLSPSGGLLAAMGPPPVSSVGAVWVAKRGQRRPSISR